MNCLWTVSTTEKTCKYLKNMRFFRILTSLPFENNNTFVFFFVMFCFCFIFSLFYSKLRSVCFVFFVHISPWLHLGIYFGLPWVSFSVRSHLDRIRIVLSHCFLQQHHTLWWVKVDMMWIWHTTQSDSQPKAAKLISALVVVITCFYFCGSLTCANFFVSFCFGFYF